MQDKKKKSPTTTGGLPPIGLPGTVPGFNDPMIDPPVPNRAWTEMRLGKDIDALTEEEKREMYIGPDNMF